MAVTLYKRQRDVYELIVSYIEKNGYSPTLKYLTEAMGLKSLSTVSEHVDILVRKGLIKRKKRRFYLVYLMKDKELFERMNEVCDAVSNGAPVDPIVLRSVHQEVKNRMKGRI